MRRQFPPDRYAVLACSNCHDYYLAGDPKIQVSITCPHCGLSRHPDRVRTVGEHPEREGAAELRARQLARDAGHGVEYADMDDYGVVGDQIEADESDTVTPDPAAGWHPEFFQAAAESIERREDDLFQSAADDAPGFGDDWYGDAADDALGFGDDWYGDAADDALGFGGDWYSDAADDAGVAHPGQNIGRVTKSSRVQ